jgi:TfoX/Sxy family transcriptional regulator of competence genes
MAYDDALADRTRRAVGPRPDVIEKKMFGGLAFLQDGRMFCGIVKDELMVRVGPERYEAALAEPHVRPMDFTGRPMTGYVYVAQAGTRTERALRKWVERGAAFVATLGGGATKKLGKPSASMRSVGAPRRASSGRGGGR